MLKEDNPCCGDNLFKRELDNILGSLNSLSVGNYTKSYETWKRAQNIIACYREELSKKNGPLRILDIGCSQGLYIFLLSSIPGLNKKVSFYGLDISASSLRTAEKIRNILGLNDVNFIAADIQDNALPDSYFDIVICAEIIEHIADSGSFLIQLRRIIKPGGAAIITTPNKGNLFLKLKKIFSFLPQKKEINLQYENIRQGLNDNMHVSVRGVNEWITFIRKNGLKIDSIKRGSLFRGGPKYDAFPVLFGISLILDSLLDYLPFTLRLTENVTFKLRKPIDAQI